MTVAASHSDLDPPFSICLTLESSVGSDFERSGLPFSRFREGIRKVFSIGKSSPLLGHLMNYVWRIGEHNISKKKKYINSKYYKINCSFVF